MISKTLWKLRIFYLNVKWTIYWLVIYTLNLEEWADDRWYRRYQSRYIKRPANVNRS